MIWLAVVHVFFNFVSCDIFDNPPNLVNNFDPRFGPGESEPPQSYLAPGLKHRYVPPSDEPRSFFPHGVPSGLPTPGESLPDFSEMKAQPYELYDLEEKLTRTGKWPEFIKKLQEQEDRPEKQKKKESWEQQVYKWAAYAKSLGDAPTTTTTRRSILRIAPPKEKPTIGMEGYWSEENEKPPQPIQTDVKDTQNNPELIPAREAMRMAMKKMTYKEDELNAALRAAKPNQPPPGFKYPSDDDDHPPEFAPPPPDSHPPDAPPPDSPPQNTPPPLQNNDIMRMMLIKIQSLENKINEQAKTVSPRFLPGFPPEKPRHLNRANDTAADKDAFKDFPVVDDFNSPIRWVKLISNETDDGLAKVTDPETGKNRQYIVNGIYYVPIIDYNVERIGITTEKTTLAPLLTTETNILRTVMKNVNTKSPDERDWLAVEVIMGGGDRNETACDGDKCQARCRTMGCQTMCDGDGCAAGCVGPACTAHCSGPGCFSMCIGERCTALCDGLSCDSRCRGKNCEANCQKFSCYKTVNGKFSRGAGYYNQWYPQRDA